MPSQSGINIAISTHAPTEGSDFDTDYTGQAV